MPSNRNAMPGKPGFACLRKSVAGVLGAALTSLPVSAQESRELVSLINAYRSAPQTCEGKRTAAAAPLAPDPVLARVQITSGAQLQQALKDAAYQAARAQAIVVSGPSNPDAAMAFLKRQYCSVLLSPRYAAIGASRSADTWRIVLAQPLLSAQLGGWPQAGKEILKLVNAARSRPRSCGQQRFGAAPPVVWNEKLAAAALAHSRDMAHQDYFRHEGKDGSQASDRAQREGYNWSLVGENIAAGQGSPQQVVSGWLSSPGHCANIMNRGFAEMGAAYVVKADSNATIYWTQVFGTRR